MRMTSCIEKNLSILMFCTLLIGAARAKQFDFRSRELFSDSKVDYNARWINLEDGPEKSIIKLASILMKTSSGSAILRNAKDKASERGQTLSDIIKAGSGSITDTTLVRKFSKATPDRVIYESRSTVYINRGLTVTNALLDMAHELTHYVYRKPFNPYRNKFNITTFITSTIEGRGGEVDAYLVECKVYKELFPKKVFRQSNCFNIVDESTGEFSRSLAVTHFYKVGEHYNELVEKLRGRVKIDSSVYNSISSKKSIFISSAYGVPYPLAAVKEYELIHERVCANDKKRLGLMKKNFGRNIASENDVKYLRYKELRGRFLSRCDTERLQAKNFN